MIGSGNHLPRLAAVATSLLMAGCINMGPDYVPPKNKDVPAAFSGNQPGNVTLPANSSRWWLVFADKGLNAVMDEALNNSPDLAAAVARLDQAGASVGAVKAGERPNARFDLAAKPNQTSTQTIPIPGQPLSYRFDNSNFKMAVGAAYEVDLWGRIRRSVESARADLQASEADLAAVRLELETEVALAWFSMQELHSEESIRKEMLNTSGEIVRLLQVRVDAGLDNEAELCRARMALSRNQVEYAAIASRISSAEKRLSMLAGHMDSKWNPPLPDGLQDAPAISPGIPAEVLARRPDVAIAEAKLHSATAQIGVAKAVRFPKISLSGQTGFENDNLLHLFEGNSNFWDIGPSMEMCLFDGGWSKAKVNLAMAKTSEALAEYRSVSIRAITEVETILVSLHSLSDQENALGESCKTATKAVQIAKSRQQAGRTGYVEVLDRKSELLDCQLQRLENRSETVKETLLLIKSLGGSW